jgi:hypothetical protein
MTHDSDAAIPTPEPDDERRSTRVAVNAEVSLRRAGHNHYRVRVYDASEHGCKLEFVERPEFEERVWVKFDGVDAIEGIVCWIDGFLVGVDFVHPIHPAVFESLAPRLR